MKTSFLLLFLFFTSTLLSANKNKGELELHLFSYHTNKVYSNSNYGVGYNYNYTEQLQFNVGYYKNSQENDSFYFGTTYLYPVTSKFKLGVGAILATGYSDFQTNTTTVISEKETESCVTDSNGDTSCRITNIKDLKEYKYQTEQEISLKGILGVVLKYDITDEFALKMMLSSDRGVSKNEPTDLIHFSFTYNLSCF